MARPTSSLTSVVVLVGSLCACSAASTSAHDAGRPDGSRTDGGAPHDASVDAHTHATPDGSTDGEAKPSDAGAPVDARVPGDAMAVTLDSVGPHALPPNWLGVNGANEIGGANDGPGWNDPHVPAALKNLGAQAVRYPGGQVANFWNWRANDAGGWEETQLDGSPFIGASAGPKVNESFGDLKTALPDAAVPVWVLNVLTWQGQVATPSDMDAMVSDQVAWLRAGAAAGLNVGALELGNEFYLPTTPGNLPEYIQRFDSGTDYANQMNGWIAKLHATFPDASIAVVGGEPSPPPSATRATEWTHDVLSAVHGARALTVHFYTSPASASESSATVLDDEFTSWDAGSSVVGAIRDAGFETWFTEFGMSDNTAGPVFAGTWLHGMYVGERLLQFLSTPGVTRVCLFNFSTDPEASAVYSTNAAIAPDAHATAWQQSAAGAAFALFGRAVAGGASVQPLAFATSATTPKGHPVLTGVRVISSAGDPQIVIINVTASTYSLDVGSLTASTGHIETLTQPTLETVVTETPVPVTTAFHGGVVTVPGYSLVRVTH